jgi:hypothetical protein
MAEQDGVLIKGHIKIEITHEDGTVETDEFDNLITTYGKNSAADLMLASPTLAKPSHIAVGTGTNTPALGDTALQTQYSVRNALSPAAIRTNNVLTCATTFSVGFFSGQVITEYGLFSHSSNATCWARQVQTPGKNLSSSDALTVTWSLTFG